MAYFVNNNVGFRNRQYSRPNYRPGAGPGYRQEGPPFPPRRPRKFEIDNRISLKLDWNTAIDLGELIGQRPTGNQVLDALGAKLRALETQDNLDDQNGADYDPDQPDDQDRHAPTQAVPESQS